VKTTSEPRRAYRPTAAAPRRADRPRARRLIPILVLVVLGSLVASIEWVGSGAGWRLIRALPGGLAAPDNWRTVYSDQFDSSLDDNWWRYSGPSTASKAAFDPQNVSIRDGCLILTSRKSPNADWAGAGVGSRTSLTYGRWIVRARIDRGAGTTLVALLWPENNSAPPEIDFAEDNGGDRSMISWSLHSSGEQDQLHREIPIDIQDFHTYSVEWTPGLLQFRVDGQLWGTVKGNRVPDQPMWLALQTEPWVTGTTWERPIDGTTPDAVNMYVDAVEIQEYVR